jgi:hypothetical protein
MQVEIRTAVDGEPSESELRILREWLLDASPRPGRIEYVQRPPQPGTMGAVADVLTVAFAAGGPVSVLAGSLAVWLRNRHQSVRLDLTRADGQRLEIDARVNDPESVIKRFLEYEEP